MRKFLLYLLCLSLLAVAIPLSLAHAAPTRAAHHWGKCPNSAEDAIRHASWKGVSLANLRRPMMCNYIGHRGNVTYWAFQHLGRVHFYSGAAKIKSLLCRSPGGRYRCYDATITSLAGTYN